MQRIYRPTIRALIYLTVSVLLLIGYMIAWRLFTSRVDTREHRRLVYGITMLAENMTNLRDSMETLAICADAPTAQSVAARIICSARLAEAVMLDFDRDRSIMTGLLDCVSFCGSFGEYAAARIVEFGALPSGDAASLGLLTEYLIEAERILLLLEHETAVANVSIASLSKLAETERLQTLFDDFPDLSFDHVSSLRLQMGNHSFTASASPLTKREAEKKAQILLESEITLTYGENKLSTVEVYSFWCDNAYVDISQNGGYPIHIFRDIDSSGTALDSNVLLTRMSACLADFGYSGLIPISSDLADGIFTAKFIYREDNLLDYTSQIQIACLADTARIVFLDASSYAAYRGAFSKPAYSADIPIFLLFDGSGSPHYCTFVDEHYYDIETGWLIHAPILP